MRYVTLLLALLAPALLIAEDRATTQPAVPLKLSIALGQGPNTPVTMSFTNQTDQPITVLKPLDGSCVNWRCVSYKWTVLDAAGRPPKPEGIGLCGTVNPLTKADFVTIPAGQTVQVPQEFLWSPTMGYVTPKGTYTITLTYTFDATRPDRGGGAGKDPALEAMLKRAWAGTVTSDPVTLEVP